MLTNKNATSKLNQAYSKAFSYILLLFVSSIVIEAIKTNSNFLRNIFAAPKSATQVKADYQIKSKRILNNKSNNLFCTKIS